MNTLYIGVGLTLILALLTALIGPFFVDWGTYRTLFEAEASRVVGLQVTVIGEVDARLLPSPRIRFGDVVIGDIDKPVGRVGRFELDLETAPLLRGDFHVSELRFERPVVEMAIDGDGRLVLPARASDARDPSSVSIDQIEISDGRVVVTDARGAGRFELTRVAAIGSAASLAGPWRFDGGAMRGGRNLSFHLAGGKAADGGLALKLQVTPGDDPATLIADLAFADGAAGPKVGGKVVIERRGEGGEPAGDLASSLATWRAETTIAGDFTAIEASGLTLALGPEERAAQFAGEGRFVLGAEPSFDLRLAARQIELDRLVRGEAGKTTVPAEVAAAALALAGSAGEAGLAGRVRVDVQGLVVGGGAVQEVGLDARTRPGGLTIERFEARLPGRTRLAASGRFRFDGGPRFDGRIETSSEQPALLASWWRAEAAGDRLDPVALSADVAADATSLRADGLRLEVARAKARGFVEWSESAGARIGLTAERLEFDQVARLARLFLGREVGRRPAALELELDAGQMVMGGVTAKGVAIGVKVAADDVAIERLAVTDLAGARLAGSGRISHPLTAPQGTLDLTLEAGKPAPAARAAATVAGLEAATVDRIAAFAAAAAPLDLALHLEGRGGTEGSDLTASLRGFAGGAELLADGRFAGRVDDPTRASTRLTVKLAGDKATSGLARLLGGAVQGPVGFDLKAEGRPIDGLHLAASTRIGPTSAGIEGIATLAPGAAPRLDGRVRLATPDAAALGGLVGRPSMAFERRLPVDGAARLSGTWPRLEVAEVSGRVGETNLRGAGRLDATRWPLAIDGRLDLDRLDLEAALEALLGGALLGEGSDAASVWATTPFVGTPLEETAVGTLAISVDRANVEDLGLDRLKTKLVLAPREVRVEAIEAGLAGGRVAGDFTLRRNPDGATGLTGRVSLQRAMVEDLVWRRGGRAVASGRLAGEASFTSSGRSAAALVAGLGGEGHVGLADARLVGVSGEALVATKVAIGETTPTTELVDHLFRARMDASETPIERADIPFALQAGVARSGRLVVETPSARLAGRVSVDLVHQNLDSEWSMEPVGDAVRATRTVISKATPTVGISFHGPIEAPTRVLDVGPLVAHLTLAGFEREIDRVETLQQDIAERARFARERRRLEEIHAAEEAARREAEARKAAEAEAARRAAQAEAEAARKAARAANEPAKPPAGGREAPKPAGIESQPPKPAAIEVQSTKPVGSDELPPGVDGPSVSPPAGASATPPGSGAAVGGDAGAAAAKGSAGVPSPASGTGVAPPPLPPPIIIGPGPAIGSNSTVVVPPMSIMPPGVQAP